MNIANNIELIWHRALADLSAEASRAFVGILWWVIEPLLYLLTFYFVFAVGFRSGGDNYAVYLLCGLAPWKWFAGTIQAGSQAIVANKGLIQQVYLPKDALVAVVLTVSTLKYGITLALLFAFLLVNGHMPHFSWLILPILLAVQLLLMSGLAMLTAACVPFIPELRLIIENGLMLLFFASGIFYKIEDRSETVQNVLSFNPMLQLIESYRDILIHNQWPEVMPLVAITGLSIIGAMAGRRLLIRLDTEFPKVVL